MTVDNNQKMSNSNNGNQTQNSDSADPSTLRRALPQFIAVGVKNLVLFGYGMTLGFPTIVIPAIQGGDGHEASNKDELLLTNEQISWLSSINLLCVPLGCFFSGVLTEPAGKRRAMQLVNIPMFISWMLFYFSPNINYLYAGLCLSGLSGGLMEAPVLTYVAEVTQPQFRGMLAATGTTCVITGIFVQFILGSFLTWRTVALVCSCLPLLTILALCFVPESPYWLLTKGRVNEASNSLAWLRGWVPFGKVENEFNQIFDVLSKKRAEAEMIKLLPFYKRFLPYTKQSFIGPFVLVSATFFIGHFSGKTPLQTYAVQIFATLKAPIDKYYATILLGAVELLGAIICVILVHLTGKRPLVFVSLIGTGLCFFSTATYARYLNIVPGVSVDNIVANFSMQNLDRANVISDKNITETLNNLLEANGNWSTLEMSAELDFAYETTTQTDYSTTENDITSTEFNDQFSTVAYRNKRMNVLSTNRIDATTESDEIILPIPNAKENKFLWLPLTLLLSSALFAHMGIRIIPWMLIGEVYPVAVRSGASGLSSGIGYIFGFLANKMFLQMLSTMTLPGTFWFYSAIALIGCVVLYFVLPETEGRTLLDIEEHFSGKKLLTDKTPIDDNNKSHDNTMNANNCANGFDLVTVIPQFVATNKNRLSIGLHTVALNESKEKTLDDDEKTNENSGHRMSVPEIVIGSSGIGSKRYKNRIGDSPRLRKQQSANDDEDTHL